MFAATVSTRAAAVVIDGAVVDAESLPSRARSRDPATRARRGCPSR